MLTVEQFATLFPFHFVLDAELRVLSTGPVLARICPKLIPGALFRECFSLSRFGTGDAIDGEFILEQKSTLFIFKATDSKLVLRMQVVALDDPIRYCFAGSPWLRSPTEMREMNLVLRDFALHDSTVDLLQLFQSTARSLEDAKQLTAKLETQRNDLRSLIDTANAPIVGINSAGEVLEWNRAMEQLTGFSKATALRTPFVTNYVRAQSGREVEALIATTLEGEATPILEFELLSTDGALRLVICSASPRHDASGKVVGAILVGQDITELGAYRATLEQRVEERTQQLSLANAELSRAMRSKDDFLSAMSHELRTPLTAVLGLSELLCEGAYGSLTNEQFKPVTTISESGQHLLSLINDLLDVAKIGAGKVELTWSVAEVRGMCEASMRLVAQMAKKKQQTMATNFDPAALHIRVDERRVKQILVNLLSNAVKFTPDGGTITLETKGDRDAKTMTFSVRDTGIGIAPQDIPRLFIPFTQLDSRLSRQFAGTGLGLTLVMLLTEHHGGHVAVESAVGIGSVFSTTLPWHEDQVAPTKESVVAQGASVRQSSSAIDSHSRAPPRDAPLILNADDSEASLTMLGDFLRTAGFRVIDVRDGSEAVAAAFEHHPALILMDLQMPVMDGLQAIRLLRSNASFAQMPIVALTSRALAGDREQCIEAGASDYLSKPVNFTSLLAILHRLLPQRGKQ